MASCACPQEWARTREVACLRAGSRSLSRVILGVSVGQAVDHSPPFLSSHWSVVLPEMVNPSLIALPSGTCNVSARDFTRITIQYDEVCLQVNKLWDIPAAKPTSQFGMVWMRGQGRVYRVRPLKSGEIWGKLPTGFQLHRPQVRTLDEASQASQAALSAWLNKPP
jgi:hypothetical protein